MYINEGRYAGNTQLIKRSLAISGFKIINLEECEMATIGQPLTAPEAGWRRYDERDSRIKYTGDWSFRTDVTADYKSTRTYSSTNDNEMQINFYGSKVRLLGPSSPGRPQNGSAEVYLDNTFVGMVHQYADPGNLTVLNFEYVNLSKDVHVIKVITKNLIRDELWCTLDAIDIDSDGYLVHPISVNLTANAGDSQVTLIWESVTGATGYNVKRATTTAGPYEIIAANISGNSYVDTDVENGTTYYYVVTAIMAGEESGNSNEASALPEADDGQAILRVTMIDSSEREYKVTKAVANDFITWCNRSIGTGNSCYAFDKGIQSSKEYLFYEKISSFEVILIA